MNFALLETLFLYTGSLIALVSFILFIFKKNRKLSDVFLGILFFNCVYLLLFNAFKEISMESYLLHNILDILSYYFYLICPPFILSYIYLSSMFEQKMPKWGWLFFIPIVVYLLVFTISVFQHVELFNSVFLFHMKDMVNPPNISFNPPMFDLLGFILYSLYFVLAMLFIGTLRPSKNRQHLFPFLFFTFFIVSLFLAAIFQYFGKYLFSGGSLIITIIFFIVIVFRYPNISQIISVSAAKRKYKHTQLKGVDLKILEKNLSKLLVVEKVFLDEELTVKSLADKLSISPHQLSEYINTTHEKSFNTYISEYRIYEAIRLLEVDSDLKVTNLSFEVGFNSVSTFYKYFKQVTGIKPLEYIRKMTLTD